MNDALASLGEFYGKVIRRWYAVGIGVIGGILGLASTLYAEAKPEAHSLVPLWVWLPLLAGGFLVAIIWAFHDVRMERDAAKKERDAVKEETESRFSELRYALQLFDIDVLIRLPPDDDAIGDAEVTLQLRNISPEDYLRCKIDSITLVIDDQRLASDDDTVVSQGCPIISPRSHVLLQCPPVRGVPVQWRSGSVEFTARYGHPSGPLRFRISPECELQRQQFGISPGPSPRAKWRFVTDPEVEDILPMART